jgi:predicted ATP-dependent serine protease
VEHAEATACTMLGDAHAYRLRRAGRLARARRRAVDALGAVERTSRGQVLLVGGEAGVGKTTLVRQFCDERGRSARVLRGRLQPSEVATSGGSAPRRA